jgi:hypothetical protein
MQGGGVKWEVYVADIGQKRNSNSAFVEKIE